MDTILERSQCNLLFTTSWMTLFSAIYCYYRGHGWITAFPSSIWATSILYWWHPDYSWRRYLDIAIVNSSLLTQHILVYNAEHAVPYYVFCLTGAGSYVLSIFFYRANEFWASTIAHAALHILTNIGTLILYSGKV